MYKKIKKYYLKTLKEEREAAYHGYLKTPDAICI
jgi:hypothetical protein